MSELALRTVDSECDSPKISENKQKLLQLSQDVLAKNNRVNLRIQTLKKLQKNFSMQEGIISEFKHNQVVPSTLTSTTQGIFENHERERVK